MKVRAPSKSFGVLICLGCYQKYRLGGLSSKHLFLSLRRWKSEIRVSAWTGFRESSLPNCRQLASPCIVTWWKERKREREPALWPPLIRALTNPIQLEFHLHDLIPSQKAQPPDIITLGLKISKYEFWGDINILSMTLDLFRGIKCVRHIQILERELAHTKNQTITSDIAWTFPALVWRLNSFHRS